MRRVYRGELAKHGVSEGTKAVLKYKKSNPSGGAASAAEGGLAKVVGLQFAPEHVALVAARLSPHTPLFGVGAVYLTAALEYLVAEVLELAGKEAKEGTSSSTFITPRHIGLAIRGDEELNKMFRKHVIRQSGVVPSIHSVLTREQEAGRMGCTTPFEDMMMAKAQASRPSLPCFVDPRTGLHCVVAGGELRPFPLFDVMSKEDQITRRGLAQAVLTAVETGVMKGEGYHFSRKTDEGDDDDAEEGWGKPSLATTHIRRLREMRHMQVRSTLLAYELTYFPLGKMHSDLSSHIPRPQTSRLDPHPLASHPFDLSPDASTHSDLSLRPFRP